MSTAGTGAARTEAGRSHVVQLPDTLCLTALTVATVISFCRVFADWEYLGDKIGRAHV